MNPIPPGSAITTTQLPPDGVLVLVLLATMTTISVIFVMMLWSLFDADRLESDAVWPRRAVPADRRSKPTGGTRIDLIRPWPARRPAIDTHGG